MRRLVWVLAGGVVVCLFLAFAALRGWNLWGQAKLGEPCSGRGGCRSLWCLEHAIEKGGEKRVPGYCTEKCDADGDCAAPGLKCVPPSQAAVDDLAKYGRPKKLCERVTP